VLLGVHKIPKVVMIPSNYFTVSLILAGSWIPGSDEGPKVPTGKSVARMVHYSGRVQGVGFRATAVEIAKDYPVTGWVKNLADGRVQMYVEGPEDAVKKFQKAILKHWRKNIEKEQVEEKQPAGKYRTFSIMR
jgi:acylphosphatase